MAKVVMFGGTGFLGESIGIELARSSHHDIVVASRNANQYEEELAFPARLVTADYSQVESLVAVLDGADVVINLAGAGIADQYWTRKYKQRLIDSRVKTTSNIVTAISRSVKPPSLYLQMSGMGYYGASKPSEGLTERSSKGSGFLADLAEAWETSAGDIASHTTRKVILRAPVILGVTGGVLAKLLPLYGMGLSAKLGSGQQGMPWVSALDVARFVQFAIQNHTVAGVYNLCSPDQNRFQDFHQAMSRAVGQWNPLVVPGFVLKFVLGEMSDLFLVSQFVKPVRLLEHPEFKLEHTKIDALLKAEVGEFQQGSIQILAQRQWLKKSMNVVWRFFSDENNLEAITPDFLRFRVIGKDTQTIEKGTHIDYRLSLYRVPMSWRTLIQEWNPPRQSESKTQATAHFVDTQEKGPYHLWHHTHSFETLGDGVLMGDFVRFKVSRFWILSVLATFFVRWNVGRIFQHRKKVVKTLKF